MVFKYSFRSKKLNLEDAIVKRKGFLLAVASLALSLGCVNAWYPLWEYLNLNVWLNKYKRKREYESKSSDFIYLPAGTANYYPAREFRFVESFDVYKLKDLLSKTKSMHRQIRQHAIKQLSQSEFLHDADCFQIGQSVSRQTLVGLARSKNAKASFFLPPPPLPILLKAPIYVEMHKDSKCGEEFVKELRFLLESLPLSDAQCCARFKTDLALKFETDLHQDTGYNLGENYPISSRSKAKIDLLSVKCCLNALLSHCTNPDSKAVIVKNGGLQLLTRLYYKYEQSEVVASIIARIIQSFSIEEKFHCALHQGGWLQIIYKWFTSESVQLSSIAASVLANLDLDHHHTKYNDGLYLLHPQHRTQDAQLDVIFLHGLKGSAFRTWRQGDSFDRTKTDSPTKCWPRDWLGQDIENIRILAIDYESEITESGQSCPFDIQRRTLKGRSEEIISMLLNAGVGCRPIVWVSHSMGGLLVKQMLVNSSQEPSDVPQNKLVVNTAGIAFYSVPHLGTSIASKLNGQSQFLISLSPEIKQLQQGSNQLLELNDEFKSIFEDKDIPLINFGEKFKTSFGLKIKAFIVDRNSADIGIGQFYELDADHLNTCKPLDSSSQIYTQLCDFIREVLRTSSTVPDQSIFSYHATSEREQFLLAHAQ